MGVLDFITADVAERRAAGVFSTAKVLNGPQAPRTTVNGRAVVNLASNDYLALASAPELVEAAAHALERYGAGMASVRPIAGTSELHVELETRLAAFKRTEAALVSQSGFTANSGTVSSLLGPDDVVVSDQLNHASLIDGCRLARCRIEVYRHADVDDARRALRAAAGARRVMLITDGVFSMDGDIAPLPDLVVLAEEHGAIMMVDDAHASGVVGPDGRGTVAHFGLDGRVHVQVGTMSKALGVMGGYVAANSEVIDFLTQQARPYLFSSAHPPSVIASALAALDIIETQPDRLQRLRDHAIRWKALLSERGIEPMPSPTPITPIEIGDESTALEEADRLLERGVFVTGIVFPTVPRGRARLRTIVTAGHDDEMLVEAADVIADVLGD